MVLLSAQALIAPGETLLMLALEKVAGEQIQEFKNYYSHRITDSVTGCGSATECYTEVKPSADLLVNILTGATGAVINRTIGYGAGAVKSHRWNAYPGVDGRYALACIGRMGKNDSDR